MPANFRREAANAVGRGKEVLPGPAKAGPGMAARQAARLIDSRAWGAVQRAPFQFVRWLAALTVVLINWAQSGPPQSAVAYLPVLTVVALLLLPDAGAISVGSLRFERLTSEMGQQRRVVDRLCDEVSLINTSLVAGSQVNITLGAGTVDAAMAAATPHGTSPPRGRSDLIAPGS